MSWHFPTDVFTTQLLNLTMREHHGNGGRKIPRAREPENLFWKCVFYNNRRDSLLTEVSVPPRPTVVQSQRYTQRSTFINWLA